MARKPIVVPRRARRQAAAAPAVEARGAGAPAGRDTDTAAETAAAPANLRDREAARIFALAAASHRNGDLDAAIRGYSRSLTLGPANADAYNNMGVALRAQGKRAAAATCYRRALLLQPNNAGIYSNLGNVLREMGQLQASAASLSRAIRLAPGRPESVYNLGLTLRQMGEVDKANACFESALVIREDYADAHWDYAIGLLLKGDFERGFQEFEWRLRQGRSADRGFEQPRWEGETLKGKTVLLHLEPGYGDMIQFVRFAQMVKERVGTVVVECQPELARLFATVRGVDKVVIAGSPLPDFDVWAPMFSLARIMGASRESLAADTPYIRPPEAHSVQLPAAPAGQRRIGIAWAAQNDPDRSCPLARFIELLGLPGIAFFSLQQGEAAKDLEAESCPALITDAGSRLGDFADIAAVVQQLDMVITVDTAIAHVAGALGKPTWVVLPFAPDWRWMAEGDGTPWYPAARLFRQDRPGDWDGVFATVRAALEAELGRTGRGR